MGWKEQKNKAVNLLHYPTIIKYMFGINEKQASVQLLTCFFALIMFPGLPNKSQAALPQGIVPFVFAKEYNVHPDILSTA